MADEQKPKIMGYDKDGNPRTFDGPKLPEGYTAECPPWAHPNTRHLHTRPPAGDPPSSGPSSEPAAPPKASVPEPEAATTYREEVDRLNRATDREIEAAAAKTPPAKKERKSPER